MGYGLPSLRSNRVASVVALGLALCVAFVSSAMAAIDAPSRHQGVATPVTGTPVSGTPATGSLPVIPAATECAVAPIAFAELTPIAPVDVAAATPAPVLPDGGIPASPDQAASLLATLRLQIACLNAGDLPRALALTGGAYYQRLFAVTGTPDEAEYAILATPLPRSMETAIEIVAVDGVVALPDGSVRADVTTATTTITVNTVTLAPAPASPTGYVIVDQRQVSRVTPTPSPDV